MVQLRKLALHIRHWRFMKGVLNLIPVGLQSPGGRKKMQQKSPGCFQHFCLAFRATHKKDWIRLVGTQTPHEISNFSGLWFILRVHQWGSWV